MEAFVQSPGVFESNAPQKSNGGTIRVTPFFS